MRRVPGPPRRGGHSPARRASHPRTAAGAPSIRITGGMVSTVVPCRPGRLESAVQAAKEGMCSQWEKIVASGATWRIIGNSGRVQAIASGPQRSRTHGR